MKYYHKIRTVNNNILDDGYDVNELLGKELYGFAYGIYDETINSKLSFRPVLGKITHVGNYKIDFFVPYKKGTKEFIDSGKAFFNFRMYADTYEEAVEMYNELVQKRIDKLKEMIQEAENDKI